MQALGNSTASLMVGRDDPSDFAHSLSDLPVGIRFPNTPLDAW